MALSLFVKVLSLPIDAGRAKPGEQTAQLFPERRRSAERSALCMGFSRDGIEGLWETAFHMALCEERVVWEQAEFVRFWGEVNQTRRFSEAIAWAVAERAAEGSVKFVCETDPTRSRILKGAQDCLEAMEGLRRVCLEGAKKPSERAWMGAREARIAKSTMAVVAAAADHEIEPGRDGVEIKRRARAFIESSGPLMEMIEASQKASEAQSRSRSNVKTRRVLG